MPRFKTFSAALLLGGTLFAAAAFAQSIGRWSAGAPMPSARTEVAVAEVGGKIYVVGGFGGERELEIAVAFQEARSDFDLVHEEVHGRPRRGWKEI